MAFRRSADDAPGSSRWRAKHRAALVEHGMPSGLLTSERTLNYVLLHGDDALGSGWDPSWLTTEQAAKLLAYLEPLLGGSSGYEIVRRLRERGGAEAVRVDPQSPASPPS